MLSPFLTANRDAILTLARERGIQSVRVFGSLAHSKGNQESDIDLLVELPHGGSLLDLVALKQDIEDLLHRTVDVVTERALSPYLRDRVLLEAVDL